MFLYNLY